MADIANIRGLRELWAAFTHREAAEPLGEIRSRLLTGLLGLGLEQALRHLGSEQPDFDAFVEWVRLTAGSPDPLAVARYYAALDGAHPPPQVQAALDAVDAAAPVLGERELAHWDEHGFVVVPQAITADEAAAAARLVWDAMAADPADPASWHGGERQGIMAQQFQHPALEPARRSARAHKAFAQLWGTADLWPSVDRVSFNPPERPGQPFPGPHLHFDASLAQPIPFATQGILYLTDTAADQGALQLVPGFHRRMAEWLGSLEGRNPREVDLSAEAITVPAGTGDLVIWRQDLPHGASPNRSDRPRLAQYINFYSARQEVRDEWI